MNRIKATENHNNRALKIEVQEKRNANSTQLNHTQEFKSKAIIIIEIKHKKQETIPRIREFTWISSRHMMRLSRWIILNWILLHHFFLHFIALLGGWSETRKTPTHIKSDPNRTNPTTNKAAHLFQHPPVILSCLSSPRASKFNHPPSPSRILTTHSEHLPRFPPQSLLSLLNQTLHAWEEADQQIEETDGSGRQGKEEK